MEPMRAIITADGVSPREILFVKYEFNQPIDVEGQPIGRTIGGKIHLRVKSSDEGNTDIFEWMIDTYMNKSGMISFIDRYESVIKQLVFKEGYVVGYSETFDSSNEIVLYEDFTISANEIQVGKFCHKNHWTCD